MKKLRPFLPGVVMAAFLLLTDGCASTDPDTVKTRGVYTTLAVEGQSLDLILVGCGGFFSRFFWGCTTPEIFWLR